MRLSIFLIFILFLIPLVNSIDLKFGEKYSSRAHEISAQINILNAGWKAEPQFHSWTLKEIKNLMGALSGGPKLEKFVHSDVDQVDIPDSFDSRTQWPNCPSISYIRDQSNCGSCWAFGAVEAISDRICVASKGQLKPEISAADLASCCWLCGFGCYGGYPAMAWRYWVYSGLVSGGRYNDTQSCEPYPLPPCEHHSSGPLPTCSGSAYMGWCKRRCTNPKFSLSYAADKHYGAKAYSVPSDVKQIQIEIMRNGPVEAALMVYEDFINYRSGVYQHVSGGFLGGHAVRLLGWGVENGTPYWLVANSWNEDWGDRGYFKILRGKDECQFEDNIVAGLPKL